jgi:hypothetical protein
MESYYPLLPSWPSNFRKNWYNEKDVRTIEEKNCCLIIQNYVNHFLYGSVMSIIKPKHCNWWGSIVSCSLTTGLVAPKPHQLLYS